MATTRLPAGDKVPDETPVSRQPAGARELLAYHVGLAGDGRRCLTTCRSRLSAAR
ncbi:hypothetical protein I552_9771 [Mycobacterium xenopi 3993]|nr:hypothetical protein I552_9771 [Mycobacterium xenopi 3993]